MTIEKLVMCVSKPKFRKSILFSQQFLSISNADVVSKDQSQSMRLLLKRIESQKVITKAFLSNFASLGQAFCTREQ